MDLILCHVNFIWIELLFFLKKSLKINHSFEKGPFPWVRKIVRIFKVFNKEFQILLVLPNRKLGCCMPQESKPLTSELSAIAVSVSSTSPQSIPFFRILTGCSVPSGTKYCWCCTLTRKHFCGLDCYLRPGFLGLFLFSKYIKVKISEAAFLSWHLFKKEREGL